jgi:hypothetical protein
MIATAVIGGAVAYKTSKDSQDYNEQVNKQNQKVAEAQAVDAERLGQIEAQEKRLQTRLKIANQTVGFAAQNVEATGTALDILGDTAMFGQIDEDRIRANAQRRAWGFRMQKYDLEAQKRLGAYQGKMDRFGTILTTAGKVAGSFGGGSFGGGGGGGGGTNFGIPMPGSGPAPGFG